MDLADIRRAALAAREFTHVVGGVTYTLRVPTPFEVDCAAGDAGGVRAAGAMVRTQRALIELAIVGWAGLTEAMLLPAGHKHATDEPVLFDKAAVPLVLDQLPAVADELWPPLSERLVKRSGAAEAARKNSPRASPGRNPKPVRAS